MAGPEQLQEPAFRQERLLPAVPDRGLEAAGRTEGPRGRRPRPPAAAVLQFRLGGQRESGDDTRLIERPADLARPALVANQGCPVGQPGGRLPVLAKGLPRASALPPPTPPPRERRAPRPGPPRARRDYPRPARAMPVPSCLLPPPRPEAGHRTRHDRTRPDRSGPDRSSRPGPSAARRDCRGGVRTPAGPAAAVRPAQHSWNRPDDPIAPDHGSGRRDLVDRTGIIARPGIGIPARISPAAPARAKPAGCSVRIRLVPGFVLPAPRRTRGVRICPARGHPSRRLRNPSESTGQL